MSRSTEGLAFGAAMLAALGVGTSNSEEAFGHGKRTGFYFGDLFGNAHKGPFPVLNLNDHKIVIIPIPHHLAGDQHNSSSAGSSQTGSAPHSDPANRTGQAAGAAELKKTFELRMEEVVGNPTAQFVGTVITASGKVVAAIDDKNAPNKSPSVVLAPNVRATRLLSAEFLAKLIATEGQLTPEQKQEYAVALTAVQDRETFIKNNPPRRVPNPPGAPKVSGDQPLPN